ncbi:MAG: hypothetical protein LBV69_11990 [Bacteroidales bacterium]|jgi:hypothetical protein|nr:hypothetical protein [Bacteroidales bacterium]
MKKTILMFSVLLSMLILYSCEGERCANGTVMESKSQSVLKDVKCYNITSKEIIYTNENGQFSTCIHFLGFTRNEPDIIIEFSKYGYKTQTITNPVENSVIYLEKE